MWASIIAVLGTLAGGIVTGVIQHRTARVSREADRAESRRHGQLDAVTALATALAAHRRAMWMVGEARLTGQPEGRVHELRAAAHETRAAVADPAVRVRLLVADASVRQLAEAAVQAAYAMRLPVDAQDLADRRTAAVTAHDALVDGAGAYLAAR